MQFVINNWILFLALFIVLGLLAQGPVLQRLRGVRTVGTAEAIQLINRERAVVVDVREPKEFADGHIPAAINLPLSAFPDRLREIERHKQRPVILSCRTSQRSARAANLLAKAGFNTPVVLAGGITAWQSEHLPTEK